MLLQFSVIRKNLFWWAQNHMNTDLVLVGLGKRVDKRGYYYVPFFLHPVNIYMKVNKIEKTTVYGEAIQLDPTMDEDMLDRILLVHRFKCPPRSRLYIKFRNLSSPLRVLVTFNERPDWQLMSDNAVTVFEDDSRIHIPHDTISREHLYYMAILPNESVEINHTTKYSFEVYYVNCLVWENQWVNNYCLVGNKTTEEIVECHCTHLSVHSSSIFFPPNDINPILEAPLCLAMPENLWVIGFLIVILMWFFLTLTYFKGRKDTICSEMIVLDDNFPGEHYGYLVAVFTGNRFAAGTLADVGIRLYGDNSASQPVILRSKTRKVLQRSYDDWFLLSHPVSLGTLNAVHLWHNNAGQNPDWFCTKVIVYDLYSHMQYIFLVDQRLSIEMDEFHKAMVRPFTTDEIRVVKRTSIDNSVLHLRDECHLTLFTRQPRSPVTRTQHVVVFIVLIMTAMLCTPMFCKVSGPFEHWKTQP